MKSKESRLKEHVQERFEQVSFTQYTWRWMFGSWAMFRAGTMIGLLAVNIRSDSNEDVLWLKVSRKRVDEGAKYFGYYVNKKNKEGTVERRVKHLHLFECPAEILENDEKLKVWLQELGRVEEDKQQILMAKIDRIV